jgi:hypothetical protein
MDYALLGLVVIVAAVIGAVALARPQKVLPLDELLSRLSHIQGDAGLTAAQKQHLAELAYRGFEASVVSVIGGVHDVFANGAIVMKTTSRDLPLIGVELKSVSAEQLRAFDKGKPVTLRVRLPGWATYSDVIGLPAGFRDARLFFAGRWYGVKSTYRVRDPSEPKTGEFKAANKTGEFKALPTTGPKTGTFQALPSTGPKTGTFRAFKADDPKRSQ